MNYLFIKYNGMRHFRNSNIFDFLGRQLYLISYSLSPFFLSLVRWNQWNCYIHSITWKSWRIFANIGYIFLIASCYKLDFCHDCTIFYFFRYCIVILIFYSSSIPWTIHFLKFIFLCSHHFLWVKQYWHFLLISFQFSKFSEINPTSTATRVIFNILTMFIFSSSFLSSS